MSISTYVGGVSTNPTRRITAGFEAASLGASERSVPCGLLVGGHGGSYADGLSVAYTWVPFPGATGERE